jgi:hypothetical protein
MHMSLATFCEQSSEYPLLVLHSSYSYSAKQLRSPLGSIQMRRGCLHNRTTVSRNQNRGIVL